MSYSRFVGRLAAKRKPSIIREMTKLLETAPEGTVPLSGGLPNPAMFPVTRATIEASDGTTIELTVSAPKSNYLEKLTVSFPVG